MSSASSSLSSSAFGETCNEVSENSTVPQHAPTKFDTYDMDHDLISHSNEDVIKRVFSFPPGYFTTGGHPNSTCKTGALASGKPEAQHHLESAKHSSYRLKSGSRSKCHRITIPTDIAGVSFQTGSNSEFSLTKCSTGTLSPHAQCLCMESETSTPFGIFGETYSSPSCTLSNKDLSVNQDISPFCYRNQSSLPPASVEGCHNIGTNFKPNVELAISQKASNWSGKLDTIPESTMSFELWGKAQPISKRAISPARYEKLFENSQSVPTWPTESMRIGGEKERYNSEEMSTLPQVHSHGDCCRGKTKKPWTKEESDLLLKLVNDTRQLSWVDISVYMKKRSAKQCRERYHNHLIEVNKEEFTPEEDRYIFEQQKLLGNKWVQIAKHLPGRSDSQVKNRFYAHQRKLSRAKKRERSVSSSDSHKSSDTTEASQVPGAPCRASRRPRRPAKEKQCAEGAQAVVSRAKRQRVSVDTKPSDQSFATAARVYNPATSTANGSSILEAKRPVPRRTISIPISHAKRPMRQAVMWK